MTKLRPSTALARAGAFRRSPRPGRGALSARSAMNDGGGGNGDDRRRKSAKQTPTPRGAPGSALAVGAAAAAGAAAVAALATVDGLDLEDFIYEAFSSSGGGGGVTLDVDFGGGVRGALGPGTAVGALLWSFALRLASPAQLLLLFIGRVDGDAPAAWAEDVVLRNLLSPSASEGEGARGEEGAGGQESSSRTALTPPPEAASAAAASTSAAAAAASTAAAAASSSSSSAAAEAGEGKRRLARALSFLGLFLPAGVLTACALDLSLGSATWSISGGLGALAAGGLFAAGRPPAAPAAGSAEARRAEALRAAFASFAGGEGDADPFSPPARRRTVLVRSGRCHESEVFRAFRPSRAARAALRDLGRAAAAAEGDGPPSPPPTLESEFSDNEIRAEMRSWHGRGGRESERRTSQGYWKNLSLVVVEDEGQGRGRG